LSFLKNFSFISLKSFQILLNFCYLFKRERERENKRDSELLNLY